MHQESTATEHLTSVTLLPDFVLGALDEASMHRVDRHLQHCPTCRQEYAGALEALGRLAGVAPPAASVREAMLRRVATQQPFPSVPGRSQPPDVLTILPIADAPPSRWLPARLQPPGVGAWPRLRGALMPAAAAVLLLTGAAAWGLEQRANAPGAVGATGEQIEALVNDPSAAYPLDDSDLPIPAAGVLFAEPGGHAVYLVANNLPVLPGDQRYQVWLFTAENERVSAGLLSTAPDGSVNQLLQTPDPFSTYVGVGLTAEPSAGSDVPTTDMVLGGSLPPPAEAAPEWQAEPDPAI